MANRRMFSKDVVTTDAFIDLPATARALYYQLGVEADDDGFVDRTKQIMRMCCATEDDLKLLIVKQFIIKFEDGIVVITHWKMNNWIQSDRYKKTIHSDKLNLIEVVNNKYVSKTDTTWIPRLG